MVSAHSTPLGRARVWTATTAAVVVPLLIADAGEHATRRFLAWCQRNQIGQLADIEPLHIAAYIEALQTRFEKPTVKQYLAAIRALFDRLVTGHVVAVNPATSVRGPKHMVRRGKTTVLMA